MMQKKILVLGSTGAMGRYLVPLLAEKGYHVDSLSLEESLFQHPNINHIQGNAKDIRFRNELLKNNYDAIVDFVIYSTSDLVPLMYSLTGAAGHYIYLSTYRIYDGIEVPIRETSPRLLDNSNDALLKNSDDYCIYKARGEDILRSLKTRNWTIIRPAITYSLMRYQLVTLEAPCTVGRALLNKPVILPESARDIQATMSWAGDVARMIAGLLFNDRALGEAFTVATSEHHTWGEIAEYYQDICNLKPVWVDQEEYLKCATGTYDLFPELSSWQLIYDRLFHRVIDNSKVLAATGMKQDELMKLYDGLKYEIARCPREFGKMSAENPVNLRMDEYLRLKGLC